MWFILLFLLILIPDIYIWFAFVRGTNIFLSIIYWLPLIIASCAIIFGLTGYFQTWLFKLLFIILLCIAVPKLIFAAFSITGKALGLLMPFVSAGGNIVGLVLALAALGISIYGFTTGWKKITVKEINVESASLPEAFNDYRIVQLSDFHIGTYLEAPETVKHLVDKVNELHPDLILFTGDLVNTSPEELVPFVDVLSQLKAKDGVYSVLGNHDYCLYHKYEDAQERLHDFGKIKNLQHDMGWQLLLNENHIVRRGNDSIAVIGVENAGTKPFPSFANLKKANEGLSDGSFKILLSHDPSHWRREVLPDTDIQLTLAGHTHAMQLKIGEFSPSMWTYKEWNGLYHDNERHLYVSAGSGSNVAFRFGAWPEIALITLNHK